MDHFQEKPEIYTDFFVKKVKSEIRCKYSESDPAKSRSGYKTLLLSDFSLYLVAARHRATRGRKKAYTSVLQFYSKKCRKGFILS
jgi:hypothetical protein